MIQENVQASGGLLDKCTRPVFKTDALIYHAKANFGVQILSDKTTNLEEPDIGGRVLMRVYMGTRISRSDLVHDLFALETGIIFLEWIVVLNLCFNCK